MGSSSGQVEASRQHLQDALTGLNGFEGTAIGLDDAGKPTVSVLVSSDDVIPRIRQAINERKPSSTYKFEVTGGSFKAYQDC